MAARFRDRYRRVLASLDRPPAPQHGYPLADLRQAERRLGVRLPKALRDYYAVAGRHRLNRAHNRLLPPQEWFLDDGRLVFMEENQAVVFWGVPADSAGEDDPAVSQGTNGEPVEWYPEQDRCSDFLVVSLYWQAVCGGLRYTGRAEVGPAVVKKIRAAWPFAGQGQELRAFGRAGQVVCLLSEPGRFLVYAGARTKRDFRAVQDRLGVVLEGA